MQHGNDNNIEDVIQPIRIGADLWDAISRLAALWIDAVSSEDRVRAASVEHELRFFALTYASLPPDTDTVTTGRKAVLRALYDERVRDDTGQVAAMLDRAIEREERMARAHAEDRTDG